MKNILNKIITIVLPVLLLGAISCSQEYVEKTVYKLTVTKDDASKVYYFMQSTDEISYVMEAVVEEEIPAETDVSDFAKEVEGFELINMAQKEDVIYLFYDRKTIVYTFKTGSCGSFEDESSVAYVKGLYGTSVKTPAKPLSSTHVFEKWVNEEGTATGNIFAAENDTFEAVWRVKGEAPDGFVFVYSHTIEGTETWTPASSVFEEGKTIEIPNLVVCKTEVTRGEYKAIMGNDPSSYSYTGEKDNNPVGGVTWYSAMVYCNLRSVAEGYSPCYKINDSYDPADWGDIPVKADSIWDAAECDFTRDGYRMPTTAEWEYVARANESYNYAGSDSIDEVAHYAGNSTFEVGSLKANDFGVYDMTGNVWECCWDIGTEDANGKKFIVRGCSVGSDNFKRFVNYNGQTFYTYRTQGNAGLRVVRTAF